jgi:hypothetical protein
MGDGDGSGKRWQAGSGSISSKSRTWRNIDVTSMGKSFRQRGIGIADLKRSLMVPGLGARGRPDVHV